MFAALVEDLDAAVIAVCYVHTAVSIDIDGVRGVELAGTLSRGSPLQQKLAVLVELDDARILVSICYEEVAVGKNAISVGWLKCVSSLPATPRMPSVITSFWPSLVNLKTCCTRSSTTHT